MTEHNDPQEYRVPEGVVLPTSDLTSPWQPEIPPYARRCPPGGLPNVQTSLRVPARWMPLLRKRALCASEQEGRMITTQEIMRRIIAEALSQPI